MARLNDTGALVAQPLMDGQSKTTSVRKISNGFIVSESSYNPKTSDYKCTEHFQASPGPSAGESALRDAMDWMNEGRQTARER